MARKILLADDSVTAQNMGRRILSDAGYDVTTVNNGSAALKKIAESKPDLIVLDVYMPGYGGLEVCQRLREAPETARIPVLLTVGKLEPFKADEARRVRADAFIVKPFEASELLTALTKLEDKIVPQSQPTRQSRFAKALAGIEEPNPSKEFGDSETGWKNRLSIPPPPSKHRPAASEEPSAAVLSFREVTRSEEPQPAEMKSGLEEALMSSLPQDVTEEEIAAIKAAAAAFSAQNEESNSAVQPALEPPIAGPLAKAEELPPISAVTENIPVAAPIEFPITTEEAAVVESTAAAEVPAEISAPASESPAALVITEVEAGKLAHDEVTAALASLTPANAVPGAGSESEAARWAMAPVTMAIASGVQEFSGPRWIAEAVPLGDDEATLVLEQEMEKAYAAFAAADAARMSFASLPEVNAYSQVEEAPASTAEAGILRVEESSNSDRSEPQAEEPVTPAVATSGEAVTAATEANAEPASAHVDTVSESAAGEEKEVAAYAAAASASPSAGDSSIVAEVMLQPSSAVESSENMAIAPESRGQASESELAAAWANWKQIRESVIGSQLTAQIDAAVTESSQTSEAQPKSQPEDSSPAEEDSSDISNIVDSVLADLKPKLMAEIAKKMGKEKKKR